MIFVKGHVGWNRYKERIRKGHGETFMGLTAKPPPDWAHRLVDKQRTVVQKLQAEGKDTKAAKRLLAVYKELLRILSRA